MNDFGTEKTSSPVSSATRAINDAWEFLFPAATQAAITIAIALFIGASDSIDGIRQQITTFLVSVDMRGAAADLDQYKLTPLVPIVVLFLLAALVYIYNRVVVVVAALIPIRMAWSSTKLLAQIPAAEKLWGRLPSVDDLAALDQAIANTLAKARAEGKGALLSGIDYWDREFQKSFRWISYAKFAIVWSVACAFFVGHGSRTIHHPAGKAGLVLIACFAVICTAVVRCAYATKQGMWQRVLVADGVLAATGALQSTNTEAAQKFRTAAAMDAKAGKGWWWVNIAPFDSYQWFSTVRECDVIGLIPFRRNTVHLTIPTFLTKSIRWVRIRLRGRRG